MKKEFTKPNLEIIRLENDVITASGCDCYDGTTDWGAGGNTCPNLNNPNCNCKANVDDPTLGNCV